VAFSGVVEDVFGAGCVEVPAQYPPNAVATIAVHA
jgi:hypothetical protein